MRARLTMHACVLVIAGCAEAPRQAVIELMLEDETRVALTRLEVAVVTPDGAPYGAVVSVDLGADYARDGRPSLGAVPWSDGSVRLRVRGYDAEQTLRLEQLAIRATRDSGATLSRVVVRDACLDTIPCEDACVSDGAADLPGCAPACELETPANCGACGDSCNQTHVSNAECEAGECVLTCDPGFDDCDDDQRGTGCEVSLATNSDHCGRCGHPCPYGVCKEGRCVVDCFQAYFPALADAEVEWIRAGRLVGQSLRTGEGGILAGFGIQLADPPDLDTNVRLSIGLYESSGTADDSVPTTLVDEIATEITTDEVRRDGVGPDACGTGAVERTALGSHLLAPDREYWILLAASEPLAVLRDAKGLAHRVESAPAVRYESLSPMPLTAYLSVPVATTLRSNDAPPFLVFPILTPVQ